MDYALQAATMDRELGHLMPGINAAGFAPDLLAVSIEIIELVRANCDPVEHVQQAKTGKFADRMRERIDADTKFTNRVGLLEQFAVDAAGSQHQRRGKAPNATPDDNRLHCPAPLNTARLRPKLA